MHPDVSEGRYKGISDEEMMAWFRRRTTTVFQSRDVDLSGDMFSVMPVEFFLAWTIKAKTMVEIGTADGSSAIPLLKAAEEVDGCLYSVDPSTCEDAKRLVSLYNLDKYWIFCNMKSDDFFKTFDEAIDFALIDGDHAWPQVARDIENCMVRLSGKGIIIVTDYLDFKEYSDKNLPPMGDYEGECQHGIPKALSVVIPSYPEFSCVKVRDTSNPYVVITYGINLQTWGIERPLSELQRRLPTVVYEGGEIENVKTSN